MACWAFGKDPKIRNSKIREIFLELSTIKYYIKDYGVTMDLQKKLFIEPGEVCPH